MRSSNVIVVFLVLLVLSFVCASPVSAVFPDFTAQSTMNGANERPNPNASTATGSATVTYSSATDSLLVHIIFNGLTNPASAAHIHFGNPNIAGPVILPFSAFPAATSGDFTQTLTAANLNPSPANGINTFADAINAILAGNTYTNIHDSPDFPGGEIRGQLAVVPEPATLSMLGLGALLLIGRRR